MLTQTSGMALDYNQLKDQVSSIQSNISTLNRQISEAERGVTRLTREKDELQSRISNLRSKIQTQKSAQKSHQSQINNAARLQSDISMLQSHANSTTATVQDVAVELQRLKQNLNDCAAVLNGETAQLRVKTSVIDKILRKKSRHAREFKREKTAILQAIEALATVHSKVPELLPGSNMKFLELKPSQEGSSISFIIESGIPQVACRSE